MTSAQRISFGETVMADVTAQDLADKLLASGFARNSPSAATLTDPIADTPMVVTLDELRPYELDPRLTRNPLFEDIKASIRERGLDAPPPITRRPGADHYIIRNGGNTRLAILRELWSETKEERFFRIPCLFRPWPERGEIIALTGHLAENELHGGLSFIERALGVAKAQELYEQETGKSLSQAELARRLKADGYPVPQPHISRMQEAIQHLLPAIPTVLYAGLGRHQIEQLTGLRRAGERIWSAHSATKSDMDFPTLFQEVLAFFDDAAGNFSPQRVQDELVGQMAELLHMDYDTLAFEISDSERRWNVLETPPTAKPEVPIPTTSESHQEEDSSVTVAPPAPDSQPGRQSVPMASEDTRDAPDEYSDQKNARLQQHIVSPVQTTERLQSIQKLIADHTGEERPDFEHNVLHAIPVQVGGLYPITDLWHIEAALDEPQRLRTHIAQFALEIAAEADIPAAIEPCKSGIGFDCKLLDATTANTPFSRAVWALLHALSATFQPGDAVQDYTAWSPEQLGALLHGSANSPMPRLSDVALVKLFRVIRLARRLTEHEADIGNGITPTS